MVRSITWIALTTAMVIIAVATEYARSGVEIRLAGRCYAAPATVRMVVAVESDSVPKSRFAQDLALPGVATRGHGLCAIADAIARWKRDGWLT